MFIIRDVLIVEQIFLSPQVKRSAIINNKLVELLYKLPNDLRPRKLGNIRKISKLHRIIAQRSVPAPPPEMKILPALVKFSLKAETEPFT